MRITYAGDELQESGDTRHYFTVSVTIRGAGADYTSDPCVVEERAYNLRDAVRQASERPFKDWFAVEIEEERNEDHIEALRLNELTGCLFCGRPLQSRRWWHMSPPRWCGLDDLECQRLRWLRPKYGASL